MRIIFLNWRDLTHVRRGGAEVVVQGIAERLAATGHAVTFFSAHVSHEPADEIRQGVRHVRAGGRYGVYPAAYAWLRRERPAFDLLIDHVNTVPFLAPLYERARTIAFVHQLAKDVWWFEAPAVVAPFGIALERAAHLAYACTPAITGSDSTVQDLRAYGWRAPIERIRYPLASAESALVPKAASPTILSMGRLTPSKRIEHALSAFAQLRAELPQAQMWIAGSGDDPRYEGRLRAQAGTIGGVSFLGRLSDHERHERMAQAHVLFVTSVREGWGMVVTEANAAGTPAIGYDVPGLRDSIKPECGIVVHAGDVKALAEQAVRLLRDGAAYERMRLRAKADARQYSWQATLDDFRSAVRRLRPSLDV